MNWIAPALESLLSVAMASLDGRGRLRAANAGFLRLIRVEDREPLGGLAARFFVQPTFAVIAAMAPGPGGEVYRGRLTLGDPRHQPRTLHARIWRAGDEIRLLAEYDIDEFERIHAALLAINRDYAAAQFELARANLQLKQREAEIVETSLTDALTGLGNRRRMEQALPAELSRADRTGGEFCVAMADIDHFKHVNDQHGHAAGDLVLAAFGELLRRTTRITDTVIRAGGEEFLILMPHTDLAHACALADRIRTDLAALAVEGMPRHQTASFGVAARVPGEPGDALLARADQALYAAKQGGRNRVVAAPPGEHRPQHFVTSFQATPGNHGAATPV